MQQLGTSQTQAHTTINLKIKYYLLLFNWVCIESIYLAYFQMILWPGGGFVLQLQSLLSTVQSKK